MKKFKLTFIVAILAIFPALQALAQIWEVPADQKDVKNPSPFNNANVKAGKEVYNINCKSCHGDPGKNNALPLIPPPPDPASDKMVANTEADLFYKITTGRVSMPSFANTLSQEQRWKVINYLKSFDPVNAGILVKEKPVRAKISASLKDSNLILISAKSLDDAGKWGPLANAEIAVTVKRTFGGLEIGKVKTNQNGHTQFLFPVTIKGNREGMIDLELSMGEEFICDTVRMEQLKIASPTEPENLFGHRILWSTNPNTRIWLIFSFISVVTGVWIAIFYILLLFRKIYKAGKE